MTTEYEHFIEIVPAGEERLHETGFGCECAPEVTIAHQNAKPVINHYPLNRRASRLAEQKLKRAA